jgi:hypothetical protein
VPLPNKLSLQKLPPIKHQLDLYWCLSGFDLINSWLLISNWYKSRLDQMVAPSFDTWLVLWNWLSIPHHEGDLVKKLTTYQQLTQIRAWLGGSQLWHMVSLESKITLRFLVIGCIKILAWHWHHSLLYRDCIGSAYRVWSWFFSCISSFDLSGVNMRPKILK